MVRKAFDFRIYFIAAGLALLFFAALTGTVAADGPVSAAFSGQDRPDAPDTFRLFAEEAAGRYMLPSQEEYTVLELIPAFGRLFASVGSYMGRVTLYAYYAAELIPDGGQQTETSCDFRVRFFSNMSMGGNFWPGETRQRLTLLPGGIYLSGYSGDGDALVSKDNVLLHETDRVPEIMPYEPGDVVNWFQLEGETDIPVSVTGTRTAEYRTDDGQYDVKLSLEPNGTALFLRDGNDGYPPLLLKGGYAVFANNGEFTLCYLMSSPASGAMSYTGCVMVEKDAESIIFKQIPMDRNDLLVPYRFDRLEYQRTAQY